MKKTAIVILTLAVLMIPFAGYADAGADLYKAKCAMCHGADGAKNAKANLKSEACQKMSDADLTSMILEGGKEKKASHAFGAKGITAEQAKTLVAFIRTLK